MGAEGETRLGAMRRSKRVLCLEDDPTQRMALCVLLETEGLLVDEAASLARAETLLETRRYDAVVSDYWLPDGCLAQLLERSGAPDPERTIVVSGSTDLELPEAIEVLPKPVDIGKLLEHVRALVRRGA